LHSSSTAYNINGTQLANLSQVSDLGVLIDAKLVYNQHISNVIAKATQRAGVFFRGFTTRGLPLMRKAFITALKGISYMKAGNEISLDDVQCTGINSDGSYKMLIASSISPNS
jgi:hypothetical protein